MSVRIMRLIINSKVIKAMVFGRERFSFLHVKSNDEEIVGYLFRGLDMWRD